MPNRFTDAQTSGESWTDVRMHDPEEGEWDVDLVVAGGRVEYVDLRIKPELLPSFVDCLLDDLGPERRERLLAELVGDAEGEASDVAAGGEASDVAAGGEASDVAAGGEASDVAGGDGDDG